MTPKAILRMAKPFKSIIGAHAQLIGDSNMTHEDYQRARSSARQARRAATVANA